jgi:hypothetical protein
MLDFVAASGQCQWGYTLNTAFLHVWNSANALESSSLVVMTISSWIRNVSPATQWHNTLDCCVCLLHFMMIVSKMEFQIEFAYT